MNAKISMIKIKLGNREIELTAEEARAIKNELDALFGFTQIPYPVYPAPIVIERDWPLPRKWEITCGDNTVSQTLLMDCR